MSNEKGVKSAGIAAGVFGVIGLVLAGFPIWAGVGLLHCHDDTCPSALGIFLLALIPFAIDLIIVAVCIIFIFIFKRKQNSAPAEYSPLAQDAPAQEA